MILPPKIPTPATLKKYTIDEKFYVDLYNLQHGKCAVCGKEPLPGGMPLVIDHKHFRVKVAKNDGAAWFGMVQMNGMAQYDRFGGGWCAMADLDSVVVWQWAKTKDAAIAAAKKAGMKYSIRGLLCPGRWSGCNRLMGRVDNIEWLEKTLAYLRKPPARILLDR